MKDAPPDREDEEDDVDAQYRRASALDTSRPSDAVRSAVLAHAARLAGERAAPTPRKAASPEARPSPSWLGRRWAPLLGSLAVAGLAALLITPHYLSLAPRREVAAQSARPGPPPMPATSPAAPPSAPIAHTAPPAPYVPDEPAPAPTPPSAPSAASAASASRALSASAAPRERQQLFERRADRPMAPPEPQEELAEMKKGPPSNALAPPGAAATADHADLDAKLAGAGLLARSGARSNAQSAAPSVAASAADSGASVARAQSNALPDSEPDALLRRAAETGDLAALQAALTTHADLESRDARGRTPLMLATVHGQRAVVELLLAHGANPEARDAAGVSPLEVATAAHEEAIAAALRQAGGH